MNERRLPLPAENAPAQWKTAVVSIPDDDYWLAVVKGALYRLAEEWVWDKGEGLDDTIETARGIAMSLEEFALVDHLHSIYRTQAQVEVDIVDFLANTTTGPNRPFAGAERATDIEGQTATGFVQFSGLTAWGNGDIADINQAGNALIIARDGFYRIRAQVTALLLSNGSGTVYLRALEAASGALLFQAASGGSGYRHVVGYREVYLGTGQGVKLEYRCTYNSYDIKCNPQWGELLSVELVG